MYQTPILCLDDSQESVDAMVILERRNLRYRIIPTEGPGPTLLTHNRTFQGLEGIERYLTEKQIRK